MFSVLFPSSLLLAQDRDDNPLVLRPTLITMADTIQEVLGYIGDDKTNVRAEALKILAHLVDSNTVELFYEPTVFAKIVKCVSAKESMEEVINAVILLINLVAENPSVPDEARLVQIVSDVLMENSVVEYTNTFLMLLANLTVSECACESLLKNCTNCLQPFMDSYLEYNPQLEDSDREDYTEVDRWQYFSNVLCNISRLEEGRRFLLNLSSNNMSRLLPHVCMVPSIDLSWLVCTYPATHPPPPDLPPPLTICNICYYYYYYDYLLLLLLDAITEYYPVPRSGGMHTELLI